MAAPPDTLIAALLAAVLGVVAPATELVVTVLAPTPAAACKQAGARNLVAPTTTARPDSTDWQQLAETLSGELADSGDPEAQKLAQAMGGTGASDTTGTPATGSPSTWTPGTVDSTAAPRSPSRSAAPGPSAAQARPGAGSCPAPSGREAPSTNAPVTGAPPTGSQSTGVTSTGARSTPGPTTRSTSSGRSADQRWEQLAGQLAAALGGSADPRAVDLQSALDRAGPSARPSTTSSRATGSAPRTTAVPASADPGDGG